MFGFGEKAGRIVVSDVISLQKMEGSNHDSLISLEFESIFTNCAMPISKSLLFNKVFKFLYKADKHRNE